MAKNSKEAYKTANDGFLKDMAGKSGVVGKVVSDLPPGDTVVAGGCCRTTVYPTAVRTRCIVSTGKL